MSGTFLSIAMLALVMTATAVRPVAAQPPPAWVYDAASPAAKVPAAPPGIAGAPGEIGTLKLMTPASRNAVLSRISGDRVYDLSVQYFIGLPGWYGVDDLPPIVARGVVIDVAGLRNLKVLPDAYRITEADLQAALTAQRVSLQPGDIVLIRGGKITLDAAKWLAETHGAMIIGGDYLSLELYKVGRPDMTVPVHNYLINQRGVAIVQVDDLEELVRDRVYEFAFVAASLRSRNTGLQFRPLAFPLRPERQ